MSFPRKPDYKLKAFKTTGVGEPLGELGAAWVNESGSISLVLNPFVNLQKTEGVAYILFPQNKQTKKRKKGA